MNNKILKTTFVVGLILLLVNTNAEAKKRGFFSWGGEVTSKVVDFPDSEEYQTMDGLNFDAGCIYKQVSIVFIPLWNYDVRWCGYVENSDSYIEYTKEELDEFAASANVTLPATPTIDFWNKIGGKLLLLVILGGLIAYSILSPDEEEEETSSEEKA